MVSAGTDSNPMDTVLMGLAIPREAVKCGGRAEAEKATGTGRPGPSPS